MPPSLNDVSISPFQVVTLDELLPESPPSVMPAVSSWDQHAVDPPVVQLRELCSTPNDL